MSTGKIAAFSDELTAAVLKLMRSIDRNRGRIGAEANLTFSELRAISRITEAGQLTPKQLAEDLEMTTGAITAITTSLVNADMVRRLPHPTDRRSLLLELAPGGVKVMSLIYEEFEETVAGSAEWLVGAHRSTLVEALRAIASGLDDANDARHHRAQSA